MYAFWKNIYRWPLLQLHLLYPEQKGPYPRTKHMF